MSLNLSIVQCMSSPTWNKTFCWVPALILNNRLLAVLPHFSQFRALWLVSALILKYYLLVVLPHFSQFQALCFGLAVFLSLSVFQNFFWFGSAVLSPCHLLAFHIFPFPHCFTHIFAKSQTHQTHLTYLAHQAHEAHQNILIIS